VLLNYHIGRVFLVRCVLVFRCGWVGVVSVLQAEACNTDTTPTTPTQPHQPNHTETPTHIQPRTHDRCGNSTAQSQAPDDRYNNVRNMLSA